MWVRGDAASFVVTAKKIAKRWWRYGGAFAARGEIRDEETSLMRHQVLTKSSL